MQSNLTVSDDTTVSGCDEMKITETKWQWNGTLGKRSATDYIVLHHAAASTCTAHQIDEWHKAKGWSGIGYHFFVRKNGEIYRGRPIDTIGAHVLGKNNVSIGICAEGAYMRETMPQTQKKAIAELIKYLKENYYPNARIVGHCEIGDSNCPGVNYPLAMLKNYVELSEEDEAMTAEERKQMNILTDKVAQLAAEVERLKNPMIYNYIDDNMPEWAHEAVEYCVNKGIIVGTGDGLGLTDADIKACVMLMRMMKGSE